MTVKSLLALAAAFFAGVFALPASATTMPYGVGPSHTGPGTHMWIGVSNLGSTTVSLSNAYIYTSGQQFILTKASDTCTDRVQTPGATCFIHVVLPQPNVMAWVVMQASSSATLRGTVTVIDSQGNPLTSLELK